MVCRVPPEWCRDAPPAFGTHSAGFLWGTAISRSELNNNDDDDDDDDGHDDGHDDDDDDDDG